MPLDANIYANIQQPKFDNALAQYGNLLAIQNAGNQNRLADLQYTKAARDMADEDRLKNALMDIPDLTGDNLKRAQNALLRAGRVKEAQELGKSAQEARNLQTQIDEREFKLVKDRLGVLSTALAPLTQRPALTHEEAFGTLNNLARLGINTDSLRSSIPMNAAELPAWARNVAMMTADSVQQMERLAPKPVQVNDNKTITFANANPLAGPVGQTIEGSAQFPLSATPGELLTDKRAREEGALNRGVQLRGQDLQAEVSGKHYDPERGMIINTRTGGATPALVGGQALPAKQPEFAKKESANIQAQQNTIAAALKAVEKTPDAFGIARGTATLAGSLPEALAARNASSDENQARAFVFNVVSKVINERAGAAQSAQELARLRGFLPGELDNAKAIKDKLNGFQQFLSEQAKAYQAPGAAPPRDAAAPASLPPLTATGPNGEKLYLVGGKWQAKAP